MALSWAPTVEQVHALIPTRGGGRPFSDRTDPTAAQVQSLVADLTAEVVGEVGGFDAATAVDDTDVTLGDLAHRAASLGTAAQIEQAWNPERADVGLAELLRTQYLTALDRLRRKIAESRAEGPGGDGVRGLGTLQTTRDLHPDRHPDPIWDALRHDRVVDA